MQNIFSANMTDPNIEVFDTLLNTPNVKIQKITSNGQTSSSWYEQEKDEWVVLLEGSAILVFEDKQELHLKKGEFVHIPKMKKHKVTYTSSPAIWLAVYFTTNP
jgi:cupin 2 domain-containing protein